MKTASIRRASMDAIVAQAEREFPFECCGFLIGDNSVEDVRPIANIQNRMHAKDPAAFPRDARTAFLMEPKEHLAVMNEVDDRKLALRVVYHSHPDHDAYFSATDRAQACSFDPSEPDYPDTVYIVRAARRLPFASRPRRVLFRDRPRAGVLVRSVGARLSRHRLYRAVDSRGQVRARRRLRVGRRPERIRRDAADDRVM